MLNRIALIINKNIHNTNTTATMTSLDDTIISRQNLMLLDNVTNYNKPALDYFHQDFDYSTVDISLSWSLLLKMRKHKVLRLPSCSNEDDLDYNIYLERLHHCLWRRWSMKLFKLEDIRLDPLAINWNKDTDVTVLYGPDLSVPEANNRTEPKKKSKPTLKSCLAHSADDDEEAEYYNDFSSKYDYSSSVNSSTSSIFEKTYSKDEDELPQKKSLRFDDAVFKRVIDHSGNYHEIYTIINDKREQWRREQKRMYSRHKNSHSIDFGNAPPMYIS